MANIIFNTLTFSQVVHVLKEAVRNPVFKDEDIGTKERRSHMRRIFISTDIFILSEYQKTVIEADMQYYLGNPQYWMPEHFHTVRTIPHSFPFPQFRNFEILNQH
tara:strand:- start:463 stop:777 length:315 start_codon:yes stop_codon:yes gene_type:complete